MKIIRGNKVVTWVGQETIEGNITDKKTFLDNWSIKTCRSSVLFLRWWETNKTWWSVSAFHVAGCVKSSWMLKEGTWRAFLFFWFRQLFNYWLFASCLQILKKNNSKGQNVKIINYYVTCKYRYKAVSERKMEL